jgi:hypothetical protein
MTHLVLDEIYSVDVMDTRLKLSFGTAVKFVDTKHWGHTSAMAAATVLAFLATPPSSLFVKNISSQSMWSSLQKQMLPPTGKPWFGVDVAGLGKAMHRTDGKSPATSPISTGSVSAPK